MIEKIFKAYDVRATYPNPLNEEMAWKVGHATAQFLKRSRQNAGAEQQVKLREHDRRRPRHAAAARRTWPRRCPTASARSA